MVAAAGVTARALVWALRRNLTWISAEAGRRLMAYGWAMNAGHMVKACFAVSAVPAVATLDAGGPVADNAWALCAQTKG